ncbi:MAG TPA: DUF4397 domain-containing protein [Sphingobacteriaceae bacterium]
MKPELKVALLNLRGSFKVLAVLLLGIVVLTVSCKKDRVEDVQVDASALNVMNASPGMLAISFFLDNQFVNGPALLFQQQSGYIVTYTGNRKFDVTVGGTTQVLTTNTLSLQKDLYYTAFFAGTNASPIIVFTQDDLSDPPAGKAKIRFINLSPDATALDLVIKGGAKLFSGLSFKTVSDFIAIDPAVYSFELRSGETVNKEMTSVQLTAGKVYTLWAKGLLTGTGETAFNGQLTTNR